MARHDMVFDSRPPALDDAQLSSTLMQHFLGMEVECDESLFNPDEAILMDFNVDQSSGVHFIYVLPFTERRALIESTFMSMERGPAPDYQAAIHEYCSRALGEAPYRVVRTERGRLPMTTRRLGARSSRRIWRIGAGAGVARASTGYAFEAIQRDSRRVVEAIATGRRRPRPPRSRTLEALDGAFISLLKKQPELAPRLFTGMFRRAPTPSLLRFLNDRPSPLDLLRVGWSLPRVRMSAHMLTHPTAYLGRGA